MGQSGGWDRAITLVNPSNQFRQICAERTPAAKRNDSQVHQHTSPHMCRAPWYRCYIVSPVALASSDAQKGARGYGSANIPASDTNEHR